MYNLKNLMNMKAKKDYKSEVLDIVKTKDWDRARWSNDKNLYLYINNHRNTDEDCKIIWEHIRPRKYESEVLEIIETKNWDRARSSNDKSLYVYIKRHRDTDENCKIILEHIGQQSRDYESEISEIIETKNWDRARYSNDENLYKYIRRHRDTDESCMIIWEHIGQQSSNHESEISDIIRTKNWDRAWRSNDENLYNYIRRHRNTDENCKIIWEHIMSSRTNHTVEDYLLYYFKHGKPTSGNLQTWFSNRVGRNDRPCIDIKNLIVAADTYKDPIALETLSLIKNHLEKEGT
jgi:hypothetical protein